MNFTPEAIHRADAQGIDLGLLRENLLRSHDERARQHESALVFALELKRIGEVTRAQSKPIASKIGGS